PRPHSPLPSFPTRRSSDLSLWSQTPVRQLTQILTRPVFKSLCRHPTNKRSMTVGHGYAVPNTWWYPGKPTRRINALKGGDGLLLDRKSTRLNSSHDQISYA